MSNFKVGDRFATTNGDVTGKITGIYDRVGYGFSYDVDLDDHESGTPRRSWLPVRYLDSIAYRVTPPAPIYPIGTVVKTAVGYRIKTNTGWVWINPRSNSNSSLSPEGASHTDAAIARSVDPCNDDYDDVYILFQPED